MTYPPQWSPPPGGWNYPPRPPTLPPAPKQPGVAWLWAVIAVLVVLAAVRLTWTPARLVPPTGPTVPNVSLATPPASAQPPSYGQSADAPSDGFCTTYFVFSIGVTASWGAFTTAVSQGDSATALTLAKQFYAQAQAVQQADPPADVGQQIATVVADFQTAQDVLSTGSVVGLPPVDATWDDVAALQTAVDPVCG